MQPYPFLVIAALTLAVLTPASSSAQSPIPIRQLAPPISTTTDTIPRDTRVWEWSDGRVVASAVRSGRLLVFDRSLATFAVLTDSAAVNPANTPMRSLLAIPRAGDSTVVLDVANVSLLVIDNKGKVARLMALPHTRDAALISTGSVVPLALDDKGRAIYRGTYPAPVAAPGKTIATPLDSYPLVRVDFDARSVDTLATLRIAPTVRTATAMALDGTVTRTSLINALVAVDDWTVTSDGSIAMVRGHDYHIDWIRADGSRASSPKMAFDWRRVSDAEKVRITDSLRAFYGQMDHAMDSIAAARGTPSMTKNAPPRVYQPPSDMADYLPPIRANSTFADRENHIWILPTTSTQARGGLLYDVVSAAGAIVERVQLPAGATLAGFGAGDVVYLVVSSTSGTHLARTRKLQ